MENERKILTGAEVLALGLEEGLQVGLTLKVINNPELNQAMCYSFLGNCCEK